MIPTNGSTKVKKVEKKKYTYQPTKNEEKEIDMVDNDMVLLLLPLPLSPKNEIDYVLNINEDLMIKDPELERLRIQIVEIILGSKLYHLSSDKLHQKIMNVLSNSTLSTSAAQNLVADLEDQLPYILPVV